MTAQPAVKKIENTIKGSITITLDIEEVDGGYTAKPSFSSEGLSENLVNDFTEGFNEQFYEKLKEFSHIS